MKKWLLFLALVLGGLAFSGLAYLKFGKEKFIHLLLKYGPKMAVAMFALVIVVVALIYISKYRKKKKRQRQEASRIDLKDLFS